MNRISGLAKESFGPGSEFGFENPLRFFNLLAPTPQTDPTRFGIRSVSVTMHPASQKNPLPFFSLLSQFGSLPASHNRQVEGSSPSGPTILLISIDFL